MQTPRVTRSSVLGKRSHQSSSSCLITPEQTPNPKRARVYTTVLDADSNKENIAPFRVETIQSSPATPRSGRALRRANTDLATPSRIRAAPRRHASGSILLTPATASFSHLSLSTPPPTPPTSLLPIHSRARALLRPTCNATVHIAGRDAERAQIHDFLTSFINTPNGTDCNSITTLYISGSPGTGKTALVNSIMCDIDSESIKIISINCMALNSIDALWDRLLEQLEVNIRRKSVGRTKKARGRDAVDALLAALSSKCVLVLDELDHLTATLPSLVSIFSLPQSHPSILRVIAIANVHTLTSSLSQLTLHGISGVDTLHFAPYTPSQLLSILQSRLKNLCPTDVSGPSDQSKTFLPLPTLTILTKKAASMTGDVRTLFEILRGAIDLAIASSSNADADLLSTPPPAVTPAHVLSAFKTYSPVATARSTSSTSAGAATVSNEVVTKVRNLGFQARLVLLSLMLATKRLEAGLPLSSSPTSSKSPVKRTQSAPSVVSSSLGRATIDSTQLHAYYAAVLTRANADMVAPVSRSEFADLIGVLETVGLVTLTSPSTSGPSSPSKIGRGVTGRSASFGRGNAKGKERGQEVGIVEGVRCDEVLRGMGVAGGGKTEGGCDIREEEARMIWEHEKARLKKDMKTRTGPGVVPSDVFGEAMED